jgi:hypothetical protein
MDWVGSAAVAAADWLGWPGSEDPGVRVAVDAGDNVSTGGSVVAANAESDTKTRVTSDLPGDSEAAKAVPKKRESLVDSLIGTVAQVANDIDESVTKVVRNVDQLLEEDVLQLKKQPGCASMRRVRRPCYKVKERYGSPDVTSAADGTGRSTRRSLR